MTERPAFMNFDDVISPRHRHLSNSRLYFEFISARAAEHAAAAAERRGVDDEA
jgi:hypothetical protein